MWFFIVFFEDSGSWTQRYGKSYGPCCLLFLFLIKDILILILHPYEWLKLNVNKKISSFDSKNLIWILPTYSTYVRNDIWYPSTFTRKIFIYFIKFSNDYSCHSVIIIIIIEYHLKHEPQFIVGFYINFPVFSRTRTTV